MAVYFTRRAKADLEAALTPLAAALDGELDLEGAQVTGRYNRKLAFGRMTNAEGGPVRVFQTDIIDAAGGESWLVVTYPRKGQTEIRPEASTIVPVLEELHRADLVQQLGISGDWMQLEYSPEGGYVRLTVPMSTRKDIPSVETFQRQLQVLDAISDQNRAIQQGVER
jgi:hypothetical protein